MIRLRRASFFLLCLSLTCLNACAAPGPSPVTFSVRQLQVDRTEAFQAAENTLVELGYGIAQRDPLNGVLTTQPVFGDSQDQAEVDRAALGSAGRLRRIAEIRITETAGGVHAYCKVVVQKLVTEAYRLRARDLRSTDSPAETPVDREAATTREQNTVWQTIRRDKLREREILAALAQRINSHALTDTADDEP